MKIAFDGTVLHGRKSGVGYYCEELLQALLAADHDDEFFVFSHQALDLNLPSSNGNLRLTTSLRFPIRAVYLHALLPKVLKKVRPDLCHYTNFLAPVAEDHPYVVTIHDMGLELLRDAHPFPKRVYTKRLIPHVAKRARLIITNSEYSKWEIVRYLGVSEDCIRVTPLAASKAFKPMKTNHVGDPYFLYVGNLEPRKNLERLIEAFSRIPQKQHRLIVVGNRLYRGGAAEAKARALGVRDRVEFMGYVPREDLPLLFSGATAFVYPSLLEGFGLPIVEAMACGAPVITSNNSAMKEVAADAALLVDPNKTAEITDALARMADDACLRQGLTARGLERAAQFSWDKTAELTLAAYREAVERSRQRFSAYPQPRVRQTHEGLRNAIQQTLAYSKLFQYPLTKDELRERLFEVKVEEAHFAEVLASMAYVPEPDLLALRAEREAISDRAISEMRPHLRALANMPFVRMIAFSGATAHRNMNTPDDIDLFMIIEDGKVWAVFLLAIVWARAKGIRRRLCMNYLISDAALPLYERDSFTAQQAASLKPIFGKAVYDRFIASNPFLYGWFPNFDTERHRRFYPEIEAPKSKRLLENVLRFGPIHILERVSRFLLSKHLRRKCTNQSDVQLDSRRLKLHLQSHKRDILKRL